MRSLLAIGCLFVFTCVAVAQTDRGTITGTVTDPAGAVIAGANIQAKNVATGLTYPAASSATGNYTVAQLPAGTYDLTVTSAGFKQYVRAGLVVEVAVTLRIDAAMQVGTATETVEVTGAAPLLKTESAEVSYNVPTDTLNNLPILVLTGAADNYFQASGGLGNIRNPLASVTLLPGTDFTNDTILRINGMPSSSQTINIEGENANNGFIWQMTQMTQAGTDAIQEVAIQTSNFAAEYGQAGGGLFNYTMKSGTNQLHGGAFDYFVNEALNAGLPWTDAGSINPSKAGQHIRNAIRQNDFGFTLGGPIVIPKIYNGHDKTFFFFSFEQFRQSNFTTNSEYTMPTDAYRQGNFSAALAPYIPCGGPDPAGQPVCLNEVFDPTTSHLVNGSLVRNPFPNNVIPQSRIDPTAAIIQSMFPEPNAPGLFNYIAPGYSDFRHTTIPSIKIDENISSKMKLSVYDSATRTESPLYNGINEPWNSRIPQNTLAQTVRVNFDDTITPTLLLHLGAGFMHTSWPQQTQSYNQASLFPDGAPFPAQLFPYIAGTWSPFGGGFFPPGASTSSFYETASQYDIKPTFTASTTWVKGNHTFKLGATARFEGFPTVTNAQAQGEFTFTQVETSDPWQLGQPFSTVASSGLGYASFFLGDAGGLLTAAPGDLRLGSHAYSLYLQDTWKVTRKLTLELGLRWDYAILWKEEHGRMQSADFELPNPVIGGRLGAVEYQATCKCNFSDAYPFAIGPHLGVAYQITPKTVFRAGGAISYSAGSDQAGLNAIDRDFLSLGTPAYGSPAAILKAGDPYGVGNVYGNPVLQWPSTFLNTPGSFFPAPTASGIIPPVDPFISIAQNAGRLPRIFQWSIGLQREISSNLVVEAAYVGNRGAWWTAPLLAGFPNYNAVTPQFLQSQYGLNVANPNDALLLNTPINSPAVIARFPGLANPNSVYQGFPPAEPLIAALVPWPQWYGGIPPFLGPPMGRTWYDSLQAKVTKRYSHGLTVQAAYSWQKEQTNGANSATSYVTPDPPIINDVFNLPTLKQLAGFDIPQSLVIAVSYTTPKLPSASTGFTKTLSLALRDWTYSAVLRYQSGVLLPTPPSNNNLLADLGRGPANNPATWGGGYTLYNRVDGQPLFLVNPNSNFDPTQQLVLNPNAWVDAAPGQFGASAPYYNDFRWQRQPAENMGFGRLFRIRERFQLQIRAEFTNIFNRLFYAIPSIGTGPTGATNPATPTSYGNTYNNLSNLLSSGFGYVNWFNGGQGSPGGPQPRSGQIIARFQF
jgi:hypothetical protein